jgi:hypothetical protein
MRLWRRKAAPETRPDDTGLDEAHKALDEALSMWPDVREVTEHMRGIRRRNHLAEMTLASLLSKGQQR